MNKATDERHRELATTLRDLVSAYCDECAGAGFDVESHGETCPDADIKCLRLRDVLVLADIVDSAVCRNVSLYSTEFKCSRCGTVVFGDYNSGIKVQTSSGSVGREFEFRPECGAKVVE